MAGEILDRQQGKWRGIRHSRSPWCSSRIAAHSSTLPLTAICVQGQRYEVCRQCFHNRCTGAIEGSTPTRRTSIGACATPRCDFNESRPRSAKRAITAIPVKGVGCRTPSFQELRLQVMRERAAAQLADEPDQIGRQAHVQRAGSNRLLISRQRNAQQRSGVYTFVENCVADVEGAVGRASIGERPAEAGQ